MLRSSARVLATAVAVLLLAGCSAADGEGADPPADASASASASSAAASAPASATSGSRVQVAALLATLPVRREGDGERRYDREAFGYGGDLDPDADGCWTRREVLIRDSTVPARVGRSCSVSGSWTSYLDGRTTADPDAVTIDHTVPLLEAWRSGASTWSAQRLVAFGNDLGDRRSLRVVTASLNEDKGNGDPADWLPPEGRCEYVAAWVAVKARWGLSADPDEVAAVRTVLAGCGDLRTGRPEAPDLDALT